MPSAVQSPGDNGGEFLVDTTERAWTPTEYGGILSNTSPTAVTIWVDFQNSAAPSSQPAGAGGRTLFQGTSCYVPSNCKAFKVKASADGYLTYSRNPRS